MRYKRQRFGGTMLAGVLFLVATSEAADLKPGAPTAGPLPPREEQATFRLPKEFQIDLVAAEPDVIDPVAMAFDENGRIFVAEMRGYPNGGRATGTITSGRIKLLEDRDGDGVYETCTVYADGLRFPTGVMPWRGGLLVANAPDILYLEDTKGTGKADRRRTLYTGFNLANIQQIVNSLQWGLDNWVYGVAGSDGGTIRSAEKPDMPPLTLRSRGIRFHPETPGAIEPTSGGGQYGLAPDDVAALVHRHQQPAPAAYRSARPLPAPQSGACRSAPSRWTSPITAPPARCIASAPSRRGASSAPPAAKKARAASIPAISRPPSWCPGGYITSACSPVVYAAEAFPAAYRGSVFVCDPANNLIHRDVLSDHGATFIAKRASGEEHCEFLASTDNWFRPVHLTLGPDGALYVLDFYREVIETPLSLPDDIKEKLNLESRRRGRIWRIGATNQAAP